MITRSRPLFPVYTKPERVADAFVHTISILFSFAAVAVLIFGAAKTLPAADIAGLTVYSVGLIGMFAASAAYNLVPRHSLKEMLRRFDHAAIFVMIAGSYTPFALVVGGTAGHAMLVAVWAIAASEWRSSCAFLAAMTAYLLYFIWRKAGSSLPRSTRLSPRYQAKR